MARTSSDVLVETLIDWNVDTVFGLPGDVINGIIEAFRTHRDKIRFIQVRHEEAAAFAACAYETDSGTITTWVARMFSCSGNLATMACGLPYAIVGALAYPQRQVICFIGDGGLAMLMGKLAAFKKFDLDVKIVVIALCAQTLREALAEPGPVLIEAVVDPREPPMPPKATLKQAAHFAESPARGAPERGKIALTIASDAVRELI